MKKVETPMLDKMRGVKEDSQKLGTFLDWLQEQGFYLAERCGCELCQKHKSAIPDLMHATKSIEALLAEYFEIDLVKVEEERVALLAELRGES